MKLFYSLLISFLPLFLFSQVYEFPIKPGTSEWTKLANHEEMVNACQIPESILMSMSTIDLAKTCMSYPLFFEYTDFNDDSTAISTIIESFNGLRELNKRKDGTIALMNIYSQMPIQEKEGVVKENNSVLHFEYIELLLSFNTFLNQLDRNGQKKLKDIALQKYGEKINHANIYGIYGVSYSLLLGIKTITKMNPDINNKQIKDFLRNYKSASSDQLQEMSKIFTQSNN